MCASFASARLFLTYIGNKIVQVVLMNSVIDSSGDSHEAKVSPWKKTTK